jgi:segregation and condensation protein A
MSVTEKARVVATVSGRPFTEIPRDLFIPPDALEILLDSFTGPFDLLLYLIRRQNINIMDIPIALITEQYMHYIQLIEESRLELAVEYLAMAAMLAEIKSRLLLPKIPDSNEDIEDDPRLALVQKLQCYEQFKCAAMAIDSLPRSERDVFRFSMKTSKLECVIYHPEVNLSVLTTVMIELVKRQEHSLRHQVTKEPLLVKERMLIVLDRLQHDKSMLFFQLLIPKEGRMGIVITLLAILELARQSLVLITQATNTAPIRLEVVHDKS